MLQIYPLRLKPGQDLKKQLQLFIDHNHIEAGFIISCCGSLTQTNIRFADRPEGKMANGHFEIVSLSGTLSIHGSHLHLSVSDENGVTTGGHMLEGNMISNTAELVIGESTQHVFVRERDEELACEVLEVKKKHK